MSRTIEEQIAAKCVHFNGLQHDTCDAGINYSPPTGTINRFNLVPCFKANNCGCPKQRWYTEE